MSRSVGDYTENTAHFKRNGSYSGVNADIRPAPFLLGSSSSVYLPTPTDLPEKVAIRATLGWPGAKSRMARFVFPGKEKNA